RLAARARAVLGAQPRSLGEYIGVVEAARAARRGLLRQPREAFLDWRGGADRSLANPERVERVGEDPHLAARLEAEAESLVLAGAEVGTIAAHLLVRVAPEHPGTVAGGVPLRPRAGRGPRAEKLSTRPEHDGRGGDEHDLGVRVELRGEAREPAGEGDVVGVLARDKPPARHRTTADERAREPRVGLVHDPQARVARSARVEQRRRAVRGAVL